MPLNINYSQSFHLNELYSFFPRYSIFFNGCDNQSINFKFLKKKSLQKLSTVIQVFFLMLCSSIKYVECDTVHQSCQLFICT